MVCLTEEETDAPAHMARARAGPLDIVRIIAGPDRDRRFRVVDE